MNWICRERLCDMCGRLCVSPAVRCLDVLFAPQKVSCVVALIILCILSLASHVPKTGAFAKYKFCLAPTHCLCGPSNVVYCQQAPSSLSRVSWQCPDWPACQRTHCMQQHIPRACEHVVGCLAQRAQALSMWPVCKEQGQHTHACIQHT